MGLGNGFWKQLQPVAQMKDLGYLRGKKLAIDLSYWIVQEQKAMKDGQVRKPHLRGTFFRVVNLVARIGALPVFVVDGEAPLLKQGIRMKRFSKLIGTPDQSKFQDGRSDSRNSEFQENVKECVDLLELLGMPVLKANGEAESLCAELNREGVVDACVTPDSDVFLHGAKCVIKTLKMDKKKDTLVELYEAKDIETELRLQRNHLLALALLVGCDYNPKGVPGVGYAHAIPLIQDFPGSEILERLRVWGQGERPSGAEVDQHCDVGPVTDIENGTTLTSRRAPHCSKCGHPGNKREHSRLGCQSCVSSTRKDVYNSGGCSEKSKGFKCVCRFCLKKTKESVQKKSNEWWEQMRSKMAGTTGFPNEEIIKIFLSSDTASPRGLKTLAASIGWQSPKMALLEDFLAEHLGWNETYVRQKALPLLSHFCLTEVVEMNYGGSCVPSNRLLHGVYAPQAIQRIKTDHSEKLYLLKWRSVDDQVDGYCWLGKKPEPLKSSKVRSSQQAGTSNTNKERVANKEPLEVMSVVIQEEPWYFTTAENMELVKAACPDLVEIFDAEQREKKSGRCKTKRKRAQQSKSKTQQLTTTSSLRERHIQSVIESVPKNLKDVSNEPWILASESNSQQSQAQHQRSPPSLPSPCARLATILQAPNGISHEPWTCTPETATKHLKDIFNEPWTGTLGSNSQEHQGHHQRSPQSVRLATIFQDPHRTSKESWAHTPGTFVRQPIVLTESPGSPRARCAAFAQDQEAICSEPLAHTPGTDIEHPMIIPGSPGSFSRRADWELQCSNHFSKFKSTGAVPITSMKQVSKGVVRKLSLG